MGPKKLVPQTNQRVMYTEVKTNNLYNTPSSGTKQFEGSTFGARTSNNKQGSSIKGPQIGSSPIMKSYENYGESPNSK